MDKRIDNFEKGLPSEPQKQTEVVEEEEPEVVVQQPEPQPKAIEVPPPAPDNSVPPSGVTRLLFWSNGLRFSNPAVAYERLENIRKQLLAHPSWKLNIVAYADANMGNEKALLLSQQRAEEVFTYFATRGIAVERLNKTGAGASGMVGPKGDGVNRRVEMTLFR
jgi:outer membrane protein OmpA-like peptidoglycan-associated protein